MIKALSQIAVPYLIWFSYEDYCKATFEPPTLFHLL